MIKKILSKNSFSDSDQKLVLTAFEFAKKAHEGQERAGGEPYITHPVAVAEILSNLNLDSTTIAAKCCSPLPGEQILGYITKQRGVSVHRAECANLKKLNPNKVIDISWPEKTELLKLT